jgi:hypothetical protein
VKIQGPLGNSVLRAIAGYDGCTNLVEQTAPLDNVRIETVPLRSSLPPSGPPEARASKAMP